MGEEGIADALPTNLLGVLKLSLPGDEAESCRKTGAPHFSEMRVVRLWCQLRGEEKSAPSGAW